MLKNIVKIENVINDKSYIFICDNDAPLDDVEEAVFRTQQTIREIRKNINSQLAQHQAEANKQEEIITAEA